VILAAAVGANKRIKEPKRATLERCLAMPSILNMQGPLQEPSYVRARPKNSGEGVSEGVAAKLGARATARGIWAIIPFTNG
jgi:hypothetical protein